MVAGSMVFRSPTLRQNTCFLGYGGYFSILRVLSDNQVVNSLVIYLYFDGTRGFQKVVISSLCFGHFLEFGEFFYRKCDIRGIVDLRLCMTYQAFTCIDSRFALYRGPVLFSVLLARPFIVLGHCQI